MSQWWKGVKTRLCCCAKPDIDASAPVVFHPPPQYYTSVQTRGKHRNPEDQRDATSKGGRVYRQEHHSTTLQTGPSRPAPSTSRDPQQRAPMSRYPPTRHSHPTAQVEDDESSESDFLNVLGQGARATRRSPHHRTAIPTHGILRGTGSASRPLAELDTSPPLPAAPYPAPPDMLRSNTSWNPRAANQVAGAHSHSFQSNAQPYVMAGFASAPTLAQPIVAPTIIPSLMGQMSHVASVPTLVHHGAFPMAPMAQVAPVAMVSSMPPMMALAPVAQTVQLSNMDLRPPYTPVSRSTSPHVPQRHTEQPGGGGRVPHPPSPQREDRYQGRGDERTDDTSWNHHNPHRCCGETSNRKFSANEGPHTQPIHSNDESRTTQWAPNNPPANNARHELPTREILNERIRHDDGGADNTRSRSTSGASRGGERNGQDGGYSSYERHRGHDCERHGGENGGGFDEGYERDFGGAEDNPRGGGPDRGGSGAGGDGGDPQAVPSGDGDLNALLGIPGQLILPIAIDARRNGPIELCPWLVINPADPLTSHIRWDMTKLPSTGKRISGNGIVFGLASKFDDVATDPPVDYLRVEINFGPALRVLWGGVTITDTTGRGVTYGNVLNGLYDWLQRPMTPQEIGEVERLLEQNGVGYREGIEATAKARASDSNAISGARNAWPRRVDCLGGKKYFWGMWVNYTPDGKWYLKLEARDTC